MTPAPKLGLVLGFGPFGEVVDNPAARLARGIDGRSSGGVRFVGREMPTSYRRVVAFTESAIAEFRPDFVFGIGVARSRAVIEVERVGRNLADPALPDNDGECRSFHDDGPSERTCKHAAELAACLGCGVSDDAGRYVCNAWLYFALARPVPSYFVHVPDAEPSVDHFFDGFARFIDSSHGVVLPDA